MELNDYEPLISKPTQMFSLYRPGELWSILQDYLSSQDHITLTSQQRHKGKLSFEWHSQFEAKIRLERVSDETTCVDFTFSSGDYLKFLQGFQSILEDLQHVDNAVL